MYDISRVVSHCVSDYYVDELWTNWVRAKEREWFDCTGRAQSRWTDPTGLFHSHASPMQAAHPRDQTRALSPPSCGRSESRATSLCADSKCAPIHRDTDGKELLSRWIRLNGGDLGSVIGIVPYCRLPGIRVVVLVSLTNTPVRIFHTFTFSSAPTIPSLPDASQTASELAMTPRTRSGS